MYDIVKEKQGEKKNVANEGEDKNLLFFIRLYKWNKQIEVKI